MKSKNKAVIDDTPLVNDILDQMRVEQDEMVDGGDLVRFRAMYLNNMLDVKKGIFEGCNEHEIRELLKRKTLEEWVIDSEAMRKKLMTYLLQTVRENTQFLDMILKVQPIKS